MQIISGSSNSLLAKKIVQNTSFQLLKTNIDKFKDGEIKVEILNDIGKNIIIIQSTSNPVNDHLIELLLIVDTVKRAGAKNIISVMPYFGYSRQDRCDYKHEPLSASLVAKLLESAGATKIITLDLHSKKLEKTFNIPIINLDSVDIFLPLCRNISNSDTNIMNTVIVSPDIGGTRRAKNFSNLLKKDLVIIHKIRGNNNECYIQDIEGDVENKNCIIIDDIIDSGDTLCKTAKLLKSKGALAIKAYVTHAVLSGECQKKIMNSEINEVFISNSIYQKSLQSKFKVVSAEKIFKRYLYFGL